MDLNGSFRFATIPENLIDLLEYLWVSGSDDENFRFQCDIQNSTNFGEKEKCK